VTNFLAIYGIGNFLFQLRDFRDYYETTENWTTAMTSKLAVTLGKMKVHIQQQVHQSVWINIFNELDCRKKKKDLSKLTDLQKDEIAKKYGEKDNVKTTYNTLAKEYNCSIKQIRKALNAPGI
jgi:CRISPR/Cas system Type II protein with McrA/HNH and RuvC-like nuclease domain